MNNDVFIINVVDEKEEFLFWMCYHIIFWDTKWLGKLSSHLVPSKSFESVSADNRDWLLSGVNIFNNLKYDTSVKTNGLLTEINMTYDLSNTEYVAL